MPPTIHSLEEELTAALSIEDEATRVEKLLELAPRLSEPLLSQVLTALEDVGTDSVRERALSGLAPYLSGKLLDQALEITTSINDAEAKYSAIGALGRHLPEAERNNLISHVKNYAPTPQAGLKAWIGLAAYLPPDLKQEAISTALELTSDVDRAEAFIALVPHLPLVWKIRALESVRKISDPLTRVEAVAGLLPALPKKERADALSEALDLARELQPPSFQASALLALISQVPADLKKELFTETNKVVRAIGDPQERIELVIQLSVHLEPRQRVPYLKAMALDWMETITDEKDRGEALIFLARSIFPALRVEIFELAKKIKDPRVKSRVLIQLEGIVEEERESPTPSKSPSESAGSSSTEVDDFLAPGGGSGARVEVSESFLAGEEAPADSETPHVPAEESEQAKPAPAKAKTPRRQRPKVEVPSPEEIPTPAPDESVGVKAYLHSDRWTLNDQLNYSLYASAIAEFVLHEDTRPPLAIGILAPWGQGKTTLMRLIQNQLQEKAKLKNAENPNGAVAPLLKPQTTFADLRKWLRDPTTYRRSMPKLSYPTVWFNAWKYQNTEQLWAGMAYAILSQLVEQLNDQAEREKFWLALQAERLDLNEIRRDIHRMVFERIAPWIAFSLVAIAVGIILFVASFFVGEAWLGPGGGAVFLAGVLAPALRWIWARVTVDRKPLEGKFAQYVRQPTYEGKLGFFHEIETDTQKVFRLLIAEGKPVVVFIDDLDRCSPGTVAQVIEAMNLFLSADFPDCYFVVGMDAQVVAASMEVAYERLDQKMKSVTRSYGSLGWYFMDKFIQLQFSIPNLTADQRGTYLTKLFGQEIERKDTVPAAELDVVEKQLAKDLSGNALKAEELPQRAAELSKLRLQRPKVWRDYSHKFIEVSAQQLSDDSPALQKYLKRYEPFLGASPRGIKRFANLYRFYSLSQLSRQSQGLPACSPGALARWLVIMLRWPQVVRWIQWEGEGRLSAGTNAFQRAQDLEEQLLKTKSHAAWLTYLEKLDPNHSEWMSDRQLYEFLKTAAGADEKLSFAVQTGVW